MIFFLISGANIMLTKIISKCRLFNAKPRVNEMPHANSVDMDLEGQGRWNDRTLDSRSETFLSPQFILLLLLLLLLHYENTPIQIS